jgi:hypothetical protein
MEESSPVKIGVKVKVTQQITSRDAAWPTEVVGTVLGFEQRKTGSWYAHSKDKTLWLDRLTLRKENGEISVLNLDRYSRIETL